MNPSPTYGTWNQAFATWLWTNALVTLLPTGFLLCIAAFDSSPGRILPQWALALGTIGALLSLPFVPVAYGALRYILALPKWPFRLAGLLVTVAAFMGLAVVLVPLFGGLNSSEVFLVTLLYSPASLLAHLKVYRAQLFRPASSPTHAPTA